MSTVEQQQQRPNEEEDDLASGFDSEEGSHMEERVEEVVAEAPTANPIEEQQQEEDDDFKRTVRQLPETLVHFEDPVILDELPPHYDNTSDDQRMANFIHPAILAQSRVVSEKPVITTTDKILPAVLPPRVVRFYDSKAQRERLLVQPVSKVQCSRPHLSELKEVIDYKLVDARARMSGVCPVRRAIFSMLADELLRQITIDCPERGLLLRKIRDEVDMSIDAYQSLFDASHAYGQHALHEATRGRAEMLARISGLIDDTAALRKEVRRLETKHLALVKAADEQEKADTKRYQEEKTFLERTQLRLQQHLETVKKIQEEERKKLITVNED